MEIAKSEPLYAVPPGNPNEDRWRRGAMNAKEAAAVRSFLSHRPLQLFLMRQPEGLVSGPRLLEDEDAMEGVSFRH